MPPRPLRSPPLRRPVLITGCSSGIGAATARRLAERGWPVYATARDPDDLADLPEGCRRLALDVTDESSMVAAVRAIEAEHGAVWGLVNNAGYSQSGAVETLSLQLIRRQFETNVVGLVRLCQLALPAMRRVGSGRIVNMSSMGGRLTFPGAGAYHASKHAVEAFSDALRFEVAGFGVRVIVIEPGLVRTRYASTTIETIDELEHAGPYDAFHASVARVTQESYEKGPLAQLGGGPERVARVVEKALTARRPRTRYRVTASARVFLLTRRLLPDRVWDLVLSGFFPRPGG